MRTIADYDLGTALGRILVDPSGAISGFTVASGAQTAFESQVYRSATALNKVGNQFLIAGGLLAAGIGYAISRAAEFEKQLSRFSAISQATEGDMEKLRQKALQLGRDSAYGASEVVDAFVELAKAGFTVQEVLAGVGDAAVTLAAAGEISMAEATDVLAVAIRSFKLEAGDAVHVADLLAGVANASLASVDDLAVSFKYAAPVAAALGISLDDLVVALGVFSQVGIKGSTAGTSLRGMFVALTNASDKAKAKMRELGIITKEGKNIFFDAQGNAKGLGEMFQILQEHTAGLTREERLGALAAIFQRRALAAAAEAAIEGSTGFEAMRKASSDVTALDVMHKKLDNLAGALKIFKASIDTAFIQAGSPFQDVLKGWVKSLTKVVNAFASLSPKTQETIVKVVAITAAILIANGVLFKLAAMFLKLGLTAVQAARGIRLIFGILRTVIPMLGRFMLALATNPVFLIIAALVALGVALYILYRKSETFRHAVDALWQAMQTGWDIIMAGAKKVVDFVRKHWDLLLPILLGPVGLAILVWRHFGDDIIGAAKAVISWLTNNWDIILTILTGPFGLTVLLFHRYGEQIVGGIQTAFMAVVNFFQSLPGYVMTGLSNTWNAITGFLGNLPYYIGYIIGFVVGEWVRGWINIYDFVVEWVPKIIDFIIHFFEDLPGRIVGFLNLVWDAFYAWSVRMLNTAKDTGLTVFHAIVDFFEQLPGNVIGFLNQVWDGFYAWSVKTVNSAKQTGADVFNAIVNFFRQLPGNVIGFLNQTWDGIYNWGVNSYNTASDFATRIYNSIRSNVQALPGVVGDALGAVIDAFKSLITKGFNIAKDFAKGLWDGFKKGLFGSPHTKIEYAMWDMTANVQDSLKTLKRQVLGVQKIYGSMNSLGQISGPTFNRSGAQAQPALATGPVYSGDHIEVFAETNANSMDIAKDISWEKRVRANA